MRQKKSAMNETINRMAKRDGFTSNRQVWKEEPILKKRLEWWWKAYIRLSRDRLNGMSEGCIPWSSMKLYADHYGLDRWQCEFLFEAISIMDNAYLTQRAEEIERENKRK